MNAHRICLLAAALTHFHTTTPCHADPDADAVAADRAAEKAEAEEMMGREAHRKVLHGLRKAVEVEVPGAGGGTEAQRDLEMFETFEAALETKDWVRLQTLSSNMQGMRFREVANSKEQSMARKYLETLRKNAQAKFVDETKEELLELAEKIQGLALQSNG